MREYNGNEDHGYIHRATGFVSLGLFLYEVTNDENCIPDLSLASRISNLFRNNTNSTSARILLLQISCHNRRESVWNRVSGSSHRTGNVAYKTINALIFGKHLIKT